MRVTVWIQTNKVGSRSEDEIEIPDEDLEGLTGQEQDELIDDYAKDVIWNLAEWGWERLP